MKQVRIYQVILTNTSIHVISEPSGPPLGLTGVAYVESIDLNWSAPAEEFQNGVIRSYLLLVAEVETGHIQNHTSKNDSFILHSLHPYYQYKIQVSAVTIGTGPFSSIVTFRTQEAGKFDKIQICMLILIYLIHSTNITSAECICSCSIISFHHLILGAS